MTLQTILERQFPAEYLERKMEAEALPAAGREVQVASQDWTGLARMGWARTPPVIK